ncbi:MAG: DUF222 domain-containing protein, partial [Acidimicrobiales bacterium]|nr:DUF222 domain-containing protein [Acidimicrobiales bacterium]
MCERLGELRTALCHYVADFEADLVTTTDAKAVVTEAARLEAAAHTLKALAAHRAAVDPSLRRDGYRSSAEALAHQVGISTGTAKDLLTTGERLSYLDTVRRSAAQGELSAQQAAMVAEAADADPLAQERLVDLATSASLGELKHACQKTVAGADPDPDGRRRRIHKGRSLRCWTDVGGTWHLSARGNPEQGAQILSALHPYKEAAFHRARTDHRHEPEAAHAFDGLVAMAEHSMTEERGSSSSSSSSSSRRGAPAKVIIRVDGEALFRGVAYEGETAEIAGLGPVPVSAIREIIQSGNAFIAAVVTKAKRVVGVAHLGRTPTAYQKTALQWSHPTCAVQGCFRHARLEADHLAPWA